jgi:adenylate kinase
MRLAFLGPPGAGKGTQAEEVCRELRLPHISTGDILRQAVADGTELGLDAKRYMDAGELVPDEMMVRLVNDRLGETDCAGGFILDGFPRTIAQAKSLDDVLGNGHQLDRVVYFNTSEAMIIRRLTGRRICRKCGANYHVETIRPRVEGVCDRCGGELYQRDDDKLDTIKQRLKVYEEQTRELIDYYGGRGILEEVPGDRSVSELHGLLLDLLRSAE